MSYLDHILLHSLESERRRIPWQMRKLKARKRELDAEVAGLKRHLGISE